LSAQSQAVGILAHYLRIALGNPAVSDLDAEVEHVVQLIVDAAVEAVKEHEASAKATKPLRFKQVAIAGVEANASTQCSYIVAGLSEEGEVYLKFGDHHPWLAADSLTKEIFL
jgi:hypothetical protein